MPNHCQEIGHVLKMHCIEKLLLQALSAYALSHVFMLDIQNRFNFIELLQFKISRTSKNN